MPTKCPCRRGRTMKRLNQLQRNYLASLLEIGHDYKSYDDLGYEAQIGLNEMNKPSNQEEVEMIVNLVNNYIKQYWKDLKKYNEANR